MDTRTVFELRREGKIQEALDMALKLYQIDPNDSWTQSALAWPLIDLCKSSLTQNSLNQAQKYFNQLIAINFTNIDDIISSQIAFLRPKIDINYTKIQEAEILSKNGNHKLALSNMKAMFTNNELLDVHHEAFGWVIYRYIKAEENNISSVEIRSLMRDYMNLRNEKTSLLHSIFLNFALHFSKEHSDFNLYNFFLLWDPKNLRREDLCESHNDGKTYPSLISRIFREFIDKKSQIDINVLIEKVPSLSPVKILDLLRDPFYWKIYTADKENRKEETWKLFEGYNTLLKGQIGSETHSKILNSAMFSMNENDEWRFLNFFENWNPENFIENDWKEVKKEDKVYKPIAIKALKKTFELIKAGGNFNNLELLVTAFQIAISKFPKDIWIKREYAILSAKNHNSEEAIKIYKTLILELGDQAYMWHEFSQFLEDRDLNLSVGMLSKAIRLQNDESFLGDIRLDLADNLIKLNNLEEAIIELNIYAKHRELKGWKLSEKYNLIHSLVKEISTEKSDNSKLYLDKIKLAEDFAYQDIKWTELVLTDKWKNDKNKEKLNFTDGNGINISVSTNRFNTLKNIEMGNMIKFKLHNKLVEDKTKFNYLKYDIITLIAEKSEKQKWSILEDVIAIVDYINVERKIIHAISSENKELFFPEETLKLAIGDFIKGKKFQKKIKEEIREELCNISKCEKNEVLDNFTRYIAIIDSVNNEKQLFHYVVNSKIEGIIRFNETHLNLVIGDFIRLRLVHKLDKKRNKITYRNIDIEKTDKTTATLKKDVFGMLKLKYKKNGLTINWEDLEYEDQIDLTPDFGFIEDYYVPKDILCQNNIKSNSNIDATVVFTGDNWKVIFINKK
ncbi:MAG: hypothetical protein RL308_804 [Bacteroidota bacterium]|jgi:hypothetical protein